MLIEKLPQNLINQIAAGEVVERPASVVKELVENSLDAGATKIVVHLRHGGKSFIRVVDDGKGMGHEDLEVCLERHATSKLPDHELDHISFLGFRGEALPALGSISRLKIMSKERGGSEGWCIEVSGGEKSILEPIACAEGTTVELRDLFYATPARLKFLKSDSTEYQHCHDILVRLSMAHPHVTFELKHNDKHIFSWRGEEGTISEQIRERISCVLGNSFVENSLYHEAQQGVYTIRLLAGLPTMNRSQSSYQYIFVNSRSVRDRIFFSAIRQAYQDYLSKDRHPMVVAYIDMPSEEVDVNVHPAKAEVRFRHPQLVRQLLGKGLIQALQKGAHKASTTIAQSMQEKFYEPSLSLQTAKDPMTGKQSVSQPKRSFSYANSSPSSFRKGAEELFSSGETFSVRHTPEKTQSVEENDIQFSKNEENFPPLGLAVAQVHGTYIVAQAEDGLVLVDQHAAHERITYERFKTQWLKSKTQTQALLSPEVVELDETQVITLFERQEFLENLGLRFESFGTQGILVKEVPALLGAKVNVRELLLDLSDDLKEENTPETLQEKIFYRLATQACHSSVRSGRKLDHSEMNALLRQIEATPFSGQCNHGRPTYVKLNLRDLEKLFGRE